MAEARPEVTIRMARETDLERVVELIHRGAPAGGRSQEDPGPPLPVAYNAAFREVQASPQMDLYVAELAGEVVGTFHLSWQPHVSYQGRRVATIESVHVAEELRGRGIGEAMLTWAADECRRLGCVRMQLSSNKSRVDAHRFYERLGWAKSHEGMKLDL